MRVWTLTATAFVIPFLGFGCGSSTPAGPSYGSPDGRKIAELIDKLNDDKGMAARVKQLFASGVTLSSAELKKIWTIFYEVKGEPVVTGDTATATIAMRSESASSADLGTKEWAFVKEGDKWKIKSAPLP